MLSWNIKRENLAIKRKKLLLYLKQKKADIYFLQETHLDNEESTKLQRDLVGKTFFSAYSSKQRGISILIRKNLNINIYKQLTDKEGRWVAIDVGLCGIRCSLVNIYVPNIDRLAFFTDICNSVTQMGYPYVIIGRDFNQVRNPALDKSNTINTKQVQKSQ